MKWTCHAEEDFRSSRRTRPRHVPHADDSSLIRDDLPPRLPDGPDRNADSASSPSSSRSHSPLLRYDPSWSPARDSPRPVAESFLPRGASAGLEGSPASARRIAPSPHPTTFPTPLAAPGVRRWGRDPGTVHRLLRRVVRRYYTATDERERARKT